MELWLPAPAKSYSSASQAARDRTERWVAHNIYCPNCGREIEKLPNNTRAADFACRPCAALFEVKSKRGPFAARLVNGEYAALIRRLAGDENPHLFLLSHDGAAVTDFLVIPKFYFTAQVVEPRQPLKSTARRAGWRGCMIRLDGIPPAGKIYYIGNRLVHTPDQVLAKFRQNRFLMDVQPAQRGWLIDLIDLITQLGRAEFRLGDLYAFEELLGHKHPENHHIRDKIRQQLQILRDKGQVEFLGGGRYRWLAP